MGFIPDDWKSDTISTLFSDAMGGINGQVLKLYILNVIKTRVRFARVCFKFVSSRVEIDLTSMLHN